MKISCKNSPYCALITHPRTLSCMKAELFLLCLCISGAWHTVGPEERFLVNKLIFRQWRGGKEERSFTRMATTNREKINVSNIRWDVAHSNYPLVSWELWGNPEGHRISISPIFQVNL